jgi:type II secretory pathway predicted ATPase ExeA
MRRTQEGKARQAERLLRESSRAGNSHVLIIEEAHDLNIMTLKTLKRFWELEDGFKRLLAIILIGQPELAMMLDERARPEAREVIRRCEVAVLAPLESHLEEYLGKKFSRVGASLDKIFAPDAFDALRARRGPQMRPGGVVAKPSQLYPLVVNNDVIRAMNRAAQDGEDLVTGDVIRAL